ncbi:hypothetical protein ES703_107933 [subsurface metagenome]
MPEFSPSESRTAKAPIAVSPAGLSCSAELYLVSDSTKVATSGVKTFTSTGAKQNISFPITMPGAEGTYPVWLDVFVEGTLIGAYIGTEDVVIAPVGVAEFAYVSGIRYSMVGVDPYGAIIQHGEIDIKNIGDAPGVCSVDLYFQICIPAAAPPEHPEECWSGFEKGRCGIPGYYELGYRCLLSATLQPGETKTFFDEFDYSSWASRVQIYFIGSPGTSPVEEFAAITD